MIDQLLCLIIIIVVKVIHKIELSWKIIIRGAVYCFISVLGLWLATTKDTVDNNIVRMQT